MDILIISGAAFVVALLTFFSGFGLGTILTPVFMIFFPVDLAIALTGVVHFFNNIFKLILVGKQADKGTLLRFGIPARSEEHTSELQSRPHLVCRLLLEKKKKKTSL